MSNEIIENLNCFLSDLAVFYRKLQNYHWYVHGKDFFVIHSKLEEYYNEINSNIDEIAEHILILGGSPLGSMNDYLKFAQISEAKNEKISSCDVFSNIKTDYFSLYSHANEIKQLADKESDFITSSLMDDYLRRFGKILWMLTQYGE